LGFDLNVKEHIPRLFVWDTAQVGGCGWIAIWSIGEFEIGIFFQHFAFGRKAHSIKGGIDRQVLFLETKNVFEDLIGRFVLKFCLRFNLVGIAAVDNADPHAIRIQSKSGYRRADECRSRAEKAIGARIKEANARFEEKDKILHLGIGRTDGRRRGRGKSH
jgi:hypothetical protein